MKVNGKIMPVTKNAMSPEQTRETVLAVMNEQQRRDFAENHECNFAISARGIGRFRVSAFYQRNLVGMVLRRIETNIPTLDDLKLPEILKKLALTKRGLVLFVGATGTGKSTSLAAMIGYRNKNSSGHIISIEDPIEYIHQHQNCIVTQREVGIDTESFEVALKNTLRQAPDVILIGEVRTRETMDHAVAFAETGHLCLATLHANNANQALDRIINFFPADRQQQVWMDLSLNLKAIVAQQLVPTPDGKGRRAVIEVLINTPLAADLIRKGEVHELAADEAFHRAGHADLRPGAVHPLLPGRDHLRRRTALRRLGERPAPDDQARFRDRWRPPHEHERWPVAGSIGGRPGPSLPLTGPSPCRACRRASTNSSYSC